MHMEPSYFLKNITSASPMFLLIKKRNVIEHEKAFLLRTKSMPHFHSQATVQLAVQLACCIAGGLKFIERRKRNAM